MEGDISGSNITPRIREVDTIALLCACIAKKILSLVHEELV